MLREDLVAQVPLAVVAEGVVGIIEHLGDGGDLVGQGDVVGSAATGVGIEAGHDAGARGGAHGLRHVGLGEDHTLAGQSIQVGGANAVVAVSAHGIEALLIGEDEDKIWFCHDADSFATRD